jgi:hypothetical protein
VGWGAGAVAVFAVVAMLYTMRRAPDLPQRHLAVEGTPAMGSKGAVENGGPVRLSGTERQDVRERVGVSRVRRASARVVDDSDSIALRAANHPAPPMPLTEQERLLLRVVHQGDPVELAMLDPVQRAARNAEEQTEFQRFFGAAPIGQPATGQSTTEQPKTEQPKTEQPTTEQPKTEQPTTEQPPTEPSKTGDNK